MRVRALRPWYHATALLPCCGLSPLPRRRFAAQSPLPRPPLSPLVPKSTSRPLTAAASALPCEASAGTAAVFTSDDRSPDAQIAAYLSTPQSALTVLHFNVLVELLWSLQKPSTGPHTDSAQNWSLVRRLFTALMRHRPVSLSYAGDSSAAAVTSPARNESKAFSHVARADHRLCWGVIEAGRKFGPTYAAHALDLLCGEFIAKYPLRMARAATGKLFRSLCGLINDGIRNPQLMTNGAHAMASAIDMLSEWVLRPDAGAIMAREMAIAAASDPRTLYNALIHANSILRQFARAEAVLQFVSENRSAFLSTHYFGALIVKLCHADETRSDPYPHPRLQRVIGLYERAMTASAAASDAAGNQMAATYDSQFAISILYAYARLQSVAGASAVIDFCETRGIVIYRGLMDLHSGGVSPHAGGSASSSSDVFSKVLSLCAQNSAIAIGRKVYAVARRQKHRSISTETAYLDLLMRCSAVSEAESVFKSLQRAKLANLVTYNAMITGYAANQQTDKAFALFREYSAAGLAPDATAYTNLLSACAATGAVDRARELMAQLRRSALPVDIKTENAYLHALMRAGAVNDAEAVFESLQSDKRANLVTYNAMVSGYAMNRQRDRAFALFDRYREAGLEPDALTYTSLLSACSQTGAVERARELMAQIRAANCIQPQHHNVYVDVLSRLGRLDEAERHLTTSMPCSETVTRIDRELSRRPELVPTSPIISTAAGSFSVDAARSCIVPFMALIAASRARKDVPRAERVFLRARVLVAGMPPVRTFGHPSALAAAAASGGFLPAFTSMHVLMANAYSEAHRHADATKIWAIKTKAGLVKAPAKCWIEEPAPDGGWKQSEVFVNDKRFVSLRPNVNGLLPR